MVKPKSFVLELAKGYDDGTAGLPIFDLFNRMLDVSDDGKQGIFYTLCAAYALVSFIALVETSFSKGIVWLADGGDVSVTNGENMRIKIMSSACHRPMSVWT